MKKYSNLEDIQGLYIKHLLNFISRIESEDIDPEDVKTLEQWIAYEGWIQV